MSSVFNSPFASTFAPSSPSRRTRSRSGFLHSVAGWLGLSAAKPRVRAASPVQRKSWTQHQQGMLAAGEAMLARSRSEKQPLSIAVFDLDDLPELESVFGGAIAREVLSQVVLRLQGMAGSRGLVIRTDATVFTVLMPGFGRDRAHQVIERTMGSPCCIELDADDHEIVLVPDFKVHTLRADSPPLAQVYADLRKQISTAQDLERRRQRYLQRERESHTRPAELLADGSSAPSFRPAAPTIPMPLSR